MSLGVHPVIDSHQHFWDPEVAEYPWMTGPYRSLRRRFGPEDLAPEIKACGVDATIVVQARHDLDETRKLLAYASENPWIVGVVGWVDLAKADVSDTIASLRESAGGRLLVGIRHQVHDEPDPEWLLRPDVEFGLRAVADADLTYDLLVRSREMPVALEVARRLPDLRLVIDHLGKPPISTGDLEPWASLIGAFRDLENVTCKISGLVTEASWDNWQQHDLVPYVGIGLEIFGPHRLLFGSDWPVCLLAGTYTEVYEASLTTLREFLGADMGSVLGGCAVRTYFNGVDPTE
ncbi:MAG TPA: amidohydrolase family protein [Acidimicrobiia bacterium]